MKVHELISMLQELPQNAEVLTWNFSGVPGSDELTAPEPELVWNDDTENYDTVMI